MSLSSMRGKNLEERTGIFAKDVRLFVKKLPRNVTNIEDVRQLTRSSGSIGANYIEANESLGKKDFLMRIRIARKESKEALFWLTLLDIGNDDQLLKTHQKLIQEVGELRSILSAIILKVEGQKY